MTSLNIFRKNNFWSKKVIFLAFFDFFSRKKTHFGPKSLKYTNYPTSWDHKSMKISSMDINFFSELNSNVSPHRKKIWYPFDLHRSLHNFFAEKNPISDRVQATLEIRLNPTLTGFFRSSGKRDRCFFFSYSPAKNLI